MSSVLVCFTSLKMNTSSEVSGSFFGSSWVFTLVTMDVFDSSSTSMLDNSSSASVLDVSLLTSVLDDVMGFGFYDDGFLPRLFDVDNSVVSVFDFNFSISKSFNFSISKSFNF